jgi:osmotically-inducible protein OsmY
MKKLNTTLIAAAFALAFSNGALAQTLSKAEYKADKDKIAAEYKSASSACSSKTGNARDICMVEARGKQKVATAELDARNKPGTKASKAVSTAKADADYAVAKEKCDDMTGNDKSACVKEARTAQTNAKAVPHAPMAASTTKPDSEKTMAPAAASKADSEKATAPASKKETPGEYVDDAVITSKVKAAVLADSSLKSAEINVETYKGIVQLTGFVRSRADIDKAVSVARSVKGVTSVKNDMIVKGQQ